MLTLDKLCRVCLKKKSHLLSIFNYEENKNFAWLIYCISGVTISAVKEPKAQICATCASSIMAALKIIHRCQASQKCLEVYRNSSDTEKDLETWLNQVFAKQTSSDAFFGISNENAESLDEPYRATELFQQIGAPNLQLPSEENSTLGSSSPPPVNKRRRRGDNLKPPQFQCDICQLIYKSGKQLKEHRHDEHNIDDPNIYSCNVCLKRFSWKPTLYRHLETEHNILPDEKSFVCKTCGKAYIREPHLKEHIKQQHETRRFKCVHPNCERTFTRMFTLRRHFMSAHSSQARFHCADCGKYFKVYDVWKYHNEVVHKNETVYCPRCGYPFRRKDRLDDHIQNDVCKRSIIPCPYCQRRFTTKSGLNDHIRKIHKLK